MCVSLLVLPLWFCNVNPANCQTVLNTQCSLHNPKRKSRAVIRQGLFGAMEWIGLTLSTDLESGHFEHNAPCGRNVGVHHHAKKWDCLCLALGVTERFPACPITATVSCVLCYKNGPVSSSDTSPPNRFTFSLSQTCLMMWGEFSELQILQLWLLTTPEIRKFWNSKQRNSAKRLSNASHCLTERNVTWFAIHCC
jgi:hypothetical protein